MSTILIKARKQAELDKKNKRTIMVLITASILIAILIGINFGSDLTTLVVENVDSSKVATQNLYEFLATISGLAVGLMSFICCLAPISFVLYVIVGLMDKRVGEKDAFCCN